MDLEETGRAEAGEGHHICYQQKTESLTWSYPMTWWSCPISHWGENKRKEDNW